jgi:hypothetical protein
MNLYNLSQYFLKLSTLDIKLGALEWKKEDEYIPDWFKKQSPFKNYPFKNALKIFKKFGLNDFRVKVVLNQNDPEENSDILLMKLFEKMVVHLINLYSVLEKSELREQTVAFLDYLATNKTPSQYIQNDIYLKDKKLFSKGMSVFKIYNFLVKKASEINLTLIPLDKIQEFKDYSNAQKLTNLELVFSTKTSDICGMGSRGILSCQNLFEESKDSADYCIRLVGSILSKYLGICYITNGSDWKDRGEKMLYRSLIRFVINGKTNKPEIIIDKMYPAENDKVIDIIKEELQKRSKISVKFISEIDISQYYLRSEKIPQKYQSYKDNKIKEKIPHKKLLYLLNNGNLAQNKFAAEHLVNDYPELLAVHPKTEIRIIVASYGNIDKVGLILAQDSEDIVREFLAQHLQTGGFNFENYPEIYKILLQDSENLVLRHLFNSISKNMIEFIKTLSTTQQQKIINACKDEEDKETLINNLL